MSNRNLRKQVSSLLIDDGLHRHGRMHLRRIDDEVSFWVDTGPLGRRSDIAPFAGIRHDSVERLRSQFFDQPEDSVRGTVGANIGYITSGEYRSWNSPFDPSEVLAEIHSALDCLAPFCSLEQLLKAWNIEGAKAPGWRFAQITVAVLLNDESRIAELLSAARSVECKRADEICDQFRLFERRILEYLKERKNRVKDDA